MRTIIFAALACFSPPSWYGPPGHRRSTSSPSSESDAGNRCIQPCRTVVCRAPSRRNTEMKDIAVYAAGWLAKSTGKKFAARPGDTGTRAVILRLDGSGAKPDDESYTLVVTGESIVISAPNPAGVFHGVQTLRQMLDAAGKRRRHQSRRWSSRTRRAIRGGEYPSIARATSSRRTW